MKTFTTAHLITVPSEVVTEVGIITPAVAAEIVKQHKAANRSATPSTWGPYLADMVNDRWALNGSTISFDVLGKLIDGQHRLFALCEAGDLGKCLEGLPFIVVRGLPHEAMDTADTGRKRTFADQVNIAMEPDKDVGLMGTKVASSLRALYLLGQVGTGGKMGGGRLTSAQLQSLHAAHKGIDKSVKVVFAKDADGKALPVRPAVMAALHYAVHNLIIGGNKEARKAMAERVDAFVSVLRTGVPDEALGADDPALALREVFRGEASRYSENDAIKLVTWAWRAYAEQQAQGFSALLKSALGITKGKPSGSKSTEALGILNADGETSINAVTINGSFEDVAKLREQYQAERAAEKAKATAETNAAVDASKPAEEPATAASKAKKPARKGASKASTAKARKASAKAPKPASPAASEPVAGPAIPAAGEVDTSNPAQVVADHPDALLTAGQ